MTQTEYYHWIAMPMHQNKKVINQWTESAPYWEKHRHTIRGMFAPVTQALIEDAAIVERSVVLDVATGPGEPALTIAELIGPQGKVVGTDLVPEMVEAARRESQRRRLHNATFEVASADNLPFPDNSFDAVVSRFGVMFFPSPVDSIRGWFRLLKPGGRIALAVWHLVERNPFHHTVAQVVERYVESPRPAPDSPDAFRFATPGKLQAVLAEAGVTAISERLLRFSIEASISIENFWTLRSEMSETLRTRLAGLSTQQVAALRGEVIETLTVYSSDRGINFPAEVLILSGRRQLPESAS
jgi:ubiquinone/menaquinone biosynthesis C-methylase UbiE